MSIQPQGNTTTVVYALIHSPLVGPLTWQAVARKLEQGGNQALIPTLTDSGSGIEPFWKQHVESAAKAINAADLQSGCILVGHSGAGPLLPMIGSYLHPAPATYIFVDAMLPHHEWSRLDLIRTEPGDWSTEFERYLRGGGRFPAWKETDLEQIIPDKGLRKQMLEEVNARDLAFFTEPIPVPGEWANGRKGYIQFTDTYEVYADQARQAGWATTRFNAGHFHMLVDTQGVVDALTKLSGQLC